MKLFSQRKRLIGIGLTIGALGLGLLAAQAASNIRARRLRAELGRVQEMMDNGRLAVAREKLAELARDWPSDGQVCFLLGQCEEVLGRPDRACRMGTSPGFESELRPRRRVSRISADQFRSLRSGRGVVP